MDNGTFIIVSLLVYLILVAPEIATILNQIFSVNRTFDK